MKEFWHFGQYLSVQDKKIYNYPDNPYVKEVPNFNKAGENTYKALEKTGLYVLRAIALFLDLDEFHFDQYVVNGNSILRPIHYPPITKEPDNAVRAAAHGDINLITLLMGAHGKGLQVKNNKGEWIDAIAKEDEIVVNVGDMLSRYTNNKLKSTIHRVVNPPKEFWSKSRYSIPFFLHPVGSMKLNVLEKIVLIMKIQKNDDITAHDFLIKRLIDIGVMKKVMKKFSSLSDLKSLIDNEELKKSEEIINPFIKKVIPQNLEAHFSVKGRAGKPVTVIKGFNGSKDELKDLAKLLKNKCSVGGSIKK